MRNWNVLNAKKIPVWKCNITVWKGRFYNLTRRILESASRHFLIPLSPRAENIFDFLSFLAQLIHSMKHQQFEILNTTSTATWKTAEKPVLLNTSKEQIAVEWWWCWCANIIGGRTKMKKKKIVFWVCWVHWLTRLLWMGARKNFLCVIFFVSSSDCFKCQARFSCCKKKETCERFLGLVVSENWTTRKLLIFTLHPKP